MLAGDFRGSHTLPLGGIVWCNAKKDGPATLRTFGAATQGELTSMSKPNPSRGNPDRYRRELVEKNIYRRYTPKGEPVYELCFLDSDGRQRRQTVEGGIKAARAKLADIRSDQGKGKRVVPMPNLTFADAAERWTQAQAARLRPSTRSVYESHLRTHLLPRWGRRRLDSLTVDDVARLAEDMRLAGRKAWTIRGALVVAGRVLDFARRRLGWAGENPVRALDKSERPRSDQRERRILTGGELDKLLAAAREPHRQAFALAAMTGARLGEVLGLRWRNVDLDAGSATIDGQLDRRGERVPCKTKRSERTVELPGALTAQLREHKLRSPTSRGEDYVLASRTGRGFDHRTVTRSFADAVARAQIAGPAPTFHDLRHSFASRFIAAGGDLVTLSAHLGHRSPAITAAAYSHEFERSARTDERRARLDGMFGAGVAVPVAVTDRSAPQQTDGGEGGEVVDLQDRRDSA